MSILEHLAREGLTMELMDYVLTAISLASYVVGAASVIAALTPNRVDNRIVAFLREVVDFLAVNVGNAKPKRD